MLQFWQSRWCIAAAAVVMQLCLGAAYGWSVFVQPLVKTEHWSLPQVSVTFSLAIFCLGIGTLIGGAVQDRVGPRAVASCAAVLYGAGYLIASYAVKSHSLPGVYAGYGVIAGFGMGIGYICPIATLVKWFPERRGLMTGIAVCGYGMGALVMSAVAAPLIATSGVATTLATLGSAYFVLVLLAAQFHRNPPVAAAENASAASGSDFTRGEALRTRQFWIVWSMVFVNVSAGLMIISQASPMAQQVDGMTPAAAAGVVGAIAILNGLGRIVWAALSDHFSRTRVFVILFSLQAIVFCMLPSIHTRWTFTVAVALIGFAYGGGFGTLPSLTAELFGPKHIGAIYGAILLAWGIGAVPSPILIAYVRQRTGTYSPALYAIAAVMFVSVLLPVALRRPVKRSSGTAANVTGVAPLYETVDAAGKGCL